MIYVPINTINPLPRGIISIFNNTVSFNTKYYKSIVYIIYLS